MTCPRRQLGINGVRCAKEHPENMAAQRTARRFDMVMPAGNALTWRPGSRWVGEALLLGRSCGAAR